MTKRTPSTVLHCTTIAERCHKMADFVSMKLLNSLSTQKPNTCFSAMEQQERMSLSFAFSISIRSTLTNECVFCSPPPPPHPDPAEGESATAPAGQLHPDGGGRQTTAAVGRRPGRGDPAGRADRHPAAVEAGRRTPGRNEEAARHLVEGATTTLAGELLSQPR